MCRCGSGVTVGGCRLAVLGLKTWALARDDVLLLCHHHLVDIHFSRHCRFVLVSPKHAARHGRDHCRRRSGCLLVLAADVPYMRHGSCGPSPSRRGVRRRGFCSGWSCRRQWQGALCCRCHSGTDGGTFPRRWSWECGRALRTQPWADVRGGGVVSLWARWMCRPAQTSVLCEMAYVNPEWMVG